MLRRRRPPALLLAAALVAVVTLPACGGAAAPDRSAGAAQPSATASAGSPAALSGSITVLAAASLTESFTTLGTSFEQAHPGTKVAFSFGPSSGLAAQIAAGAPADVFASASPATMATVVTSGAVAAPAVFATNSMAIAVPPGNPARIDEVADLAGSAVKVAVCQAQVPCGTTAAMVFANAGIRVTPVTYEADVKAVLTKVQLGEVQAGIVYRTDVAAAAGKVDGIAIPDAVNASTDYPIATLTAAPNPAAAAAFVDLVRSDEGSAVLRQAGFATP